MKFYAIGGFNEVGKNMSAFEVNNEVVIVDMGIQVDKIVPLRGEDYVALSTKRLVEAGAIPDDKILNGKNVKAIVIGHAHLDHSDAVPRLAEKYRCPIIGTPFTCEVLKKIFKDEDAPQLKKALNVLNAGQTASISREFEVELINVTHSTPQTAIVVLHTREGAAVYLNDYKLDNTPTLGSPPDYNRIKQIGKEGVKLLVIESVRAAEIGRTPSEYVAKVMVKDAIKKAYENRTAVVISTFSSHIARLRSILEANKNKRKVAMLGRSLLEYVDPARTLGLIDPRNVDLFGKRKAVAKALESIRRHPEDWLLVVTGNQGEPNAVLTRMARGEFKFRFKREDQVIFSSDVIPNPINRANRYALEQNLKQQNVRIMENVHVSGHARREDDREMIRMFNPEMIVPSHGETEKLTALASIAEEEGYAIGRTVHVLHNGAVVDIK